MRYGIMKRLTAAASSLAIAAAAIPFSLFPATAAEEDPCIVVSLGDSYSSGEGIEKFYGQDKEPAEKVQDPDWLAHRSQLSWPGRLRFYENEDVLSAYKDTTWFFRASSGALTEDLTDSQSKNYDYKSLKGTYDLEPQLAIFDTLPEGSVDYVTVSIGGNDIGFVDIISKAVMSSVLSTSDESFKAELDAAWAAFDDGSENSVRSRIKNSYCEIAEAAGPDTHIIVAGYPTLLNQDGFKLMGAFDISETKCGWIADAVADFNAGIAGIVSECQAEGMDIGFVDMTNAFVGHEAYTSDPYLNEIYFATKSEDISSGPISSYSLHPNEKGAAVYAAAVQEYIDDHFGKVTVTYDVNGAHSGSMPPVDSFGGKSYILPENGFTPAEGYSFNSWNIDGKTYYPGDKIKLTGDITVKAMWDQKISLRLSANNGTALEESVWLSPEDNYLLPQCDMPGPDGMSFRYWQAGPDKYLPGDELELRDEYITDESGVKVLRIKAVWAPDSVMTDASVTLGGSLGLNFYFTVTDEIAASGKVVMDGPEGQQEAAIAGLTTTNGRYKATYNLNAIESDQEVSLKLTDEDGKSLVLYTASGKKAEGNTFTYSIPDYVNDALAADADIVPGGDKEKIRALYTYTSHAVKWKYGTELPGENINTLPDISAADTEKYKLTKSGEANVEIISAALLLDSDTGFKLYFKADEVPEITLNGQSIEPVKTGSRYYIQLPGIGAKDLKTEYTVVFGESYIVKFSAMSYIYSVLNNCPDGDPLSDLAKAIYAYSEAFTPLV